MQQTIFFLIIIKKSSGYKQKLMQTLVSKKVFDDKIGAKYFELKSHNKSKILLNPKYCFNCQRNHLNVL